LRSLFLRAWTAHLVVAMSILYATNMFVQSFGALSVVKINAAWFHVRERGVLSGIFAILIGLGYWFAFTVGGKIFAWSKARFGPTPMAFVPLFVAPAIFTAIMFGVLWWRVRERPSHAGHDDFNTGDASSVDTGDGGTGDEAPVDLKYVFKRVVMHPVIRVLAAAEF